MTVIDYFAIYGIGFISGLGLAYVLWVRPKFMGEDDKPSDYDRIFKTLWGHEPPAQKMPRWPAYVCRDECQHAKTGVLPHCKEHCAIAHDESCEYPHCACPTKEDCRVKKPNYRR